jgi:hypothetical protein
MRIDNQPLLTCTLRLNDAMPPLCLPLLLLLPRLLCPQMFRVVFNTVFIWKIDTDLWIWKVGGLMVVVVVGEPSEQLPALGCAPHPHAEKPPARTVFTHAALTHTSCHPACVSLLFCVLCPSGLLLGAVQAGGAARGEPGQAGLLSLRLDVCSDLACHLSRV